METLTIQYILLVIAGLCAGSFFNVLIWRLPRGESFVLPPSHCVTCLTPVKFYDNIPVLSYIILWGRCRSCKAKISPVYPAVEIFTATLLVCAWFFLDMPAIIANFGAWHELIVPILRVVVIITLIPVAVIDIRHYIIPDGISLSILALAFCAAFIPGDLTPAQSLVGAFAGGGSLFALGLLGALLAKKKDAMGLGDVKLMAGLGALWGYKVALLGIAFGALLGTLAGIVLIISKKLNSEHRIPFGPFLGGGLVAAVFFGEPLLKWYFSLF